MLTMSSACERRGWEGGSYAFSSSLVSSVSGVKCDFAHSERRGPWSSSSSTDRRSEESTTTSYLRMTSINSWGAMTAVRSLRGVRRVPSR